MERFIVSLIVSTGVLSNADLYCDYPRQISVCYKTSVIDEKILCRGFGSCVGSYLKSTSSQVLCSGHESCREAKDIRSATSIWCTGDHACEMTDGSIIASRGVKCAGAGSCAQVKGDIIAMGLLGSDHHVECIGYYSCWRVQGTIQAADDIICSATGSCVRVNPMKAGNQVVVSGAFGAAHSTITRAPGGVECNSHQSCYDAEIRVEGPIWLNSNLSGAYAILDGSDVECGGKRSCYWARIDAAEDLLITGQQAAANAQIIAYGNIEAYGWEALLNAFILIGEGMDTDVHLYGFYTGHSLTIFCDDGYGDVECNVYCHGITSCYATTIEYADSIDNVNISPSDCLENEGQLSDEGVWCPHLVERADPAQVIADLMRIWGLDRAISQGNELVQFEEIFTPQSMLQIEAPAPENPTNLMATQ